MKKKIKELTEQEIDGICNNHLFCVKCPFASSDKGVFGCYAMDTELWGELEIDYDL